MSSNIFDKNNFREVYLVTTKNVTTKNNNNRLNNFTLEQNGGHIISASLWDVVTAKVISEYLEKKGEEVQIDKFITDLSFERKNEPKKRVELEVKTSINSEFSIYPNQLYNYLSASQRRIYYLFLYIDNQDNSLNPFENYDVYSVKRGVTVFEKKIFPPNIFFGVVEQYASKYREDILYSSCIEPQIVRDIINTHQNQKEKIHISNNIKKQQPLLVNLLGELIMSANL